MADDRLELRIQECGRELFRLIRDERPSLYNTDWWTGKVLDWAMRHEEFKIQLFRFVDVLPSLADDEALARHVEEYFGQGGREIPAVLRWGSKTEGMLASSLKKNIEVMANRFIMGENTDQAIGAIEKIRAAGCGFCVDILGEAAVSEAEADSYQSRYLELFDTLSAVQNNWPVLGTADGTLDWGDSPKINLAVKPTSFYSQVDPRNFSGSVEAIYRRLLPLAEEAVRVNAFMCLDMEQHRFKDITLAVYRRLKENGRLRDYPFLGVVLQSYLKESRQDLEELLGWAGSENIPVSVRLVKGAYWDYETVVAAANGWESPVYDSKAATDASFEAMAAAALADHEVCHLACGSHNIRSIAAVLETAALLKVPEDRFEFQMLYGMAGPVRRAVLQKTGRLRLYGPYGPLLPGMGYLVRRLLENTSNQSFLRLRFADGLEIEKLLESPAAAIEKTPEKDKTAAVTPLNTPSPFRSEPAADFSRKAVREAFPEAIANVRQQLGKMHPLLIDNKEVSGIVLNRSFNPAAPQELVGSVSLAGPAEIDLAAAAAAKALPSWRATSAAKRADYLFIAARLLRRDIFELAAIQVLEVGKQWHEAHADVTEAIDFCEYYGREMLRLDGRSNGVMSMPGEANRYFYRAKGIAAVIAPWNFPLAISCGMCAAALVTGNCVLYKPSGLSPVCGARLAEIFREAGLPAGVFNFVPCRGGEVGDHLVSHASINLIVFTGSAATGRRIVQLAAENPAGQDHLKRVIAEMGGKNAIIVDEDADLDEAVPAVLRSAFGFQGQKCSACSRVIVVGRVYDRFVARLIDGARSLSIGPAENPAHAMGPVVDRQALDKILSYLKTAQTEGKILFQSTVPGGGWYVPLTIVGDLKVDDRIAREEIFGPILALLRASSFAEAVTMANETDFALTGGVFSRSPANLVLAAREFAVGNLYFNRAITGALVGRQPFGGFRMSGIGSKAGGPDYLLQFVDPVTICENTMRRGFAPEGE